MDAPLSPDDTGGMRPWHAVLAALAAGAAVLGADHPSDGEDHLAASRAAQIGSELPAAPGHRRGARETLAYPAVASSRRIGVNVHLAWTDTPYADIQAVQVALSYLDVRTVRATAPSQLMSPYETLARQGVRFNLVVPGGRVQLPQTLSALRALEAARPGALASIEGPNEVNTWPVEHAGDTGLRAAAKLQKDLFVAVKSDRRLAHVPVLNLTLGGVDPSGYAPLGDLSDHADLANAHLYWWDGAPPGSTWDWGVRVGRTSTPRLAGLAITETGYSSAAGSGTGVDELTQAKHTLNLLMNAARAGVSALYLYQLVDHAPDPQGREMERGFGLFRHDWTPKPAATAVRNFLTILTDQGRTGFRPASLKYELRGLPAGASSHLFQEAPGVFDLVVWDEAARRPKPATPREVTLLLPHAYARLAVYDPLRSRGPLATAIAKDRITFALSDHPIVLELTPGSRVGGSRRPQSDAPRLRTERAVPQVVSQPER